MGSRGCNQSEAASATPHCTLEAATTEQEVTASKSILRKHSRSFGEQRPLQNEKMPPPLSENNNINNKSSSHARGSGQGGVPEASAEEADLRGSSRGELAWGPSKPSTCRRLGLYTTETPPCTQPTVSPRPSASLQAASWERQRPDADPGPLQSARNFDFRVRILLFPTDRLQSARARLTC